MKVAEKLDNPRLKKNLDALYRSYDFEGRVRHDPIMFPKRYKRKEDIEVAGLVAASLAYGKVTLFMPVVEKVLKIMGEKPVDYLMALDIKSARRALEDLRYRFQGTDDLIALLYVMGVLIKRHGGLEQAVMNYYMELDPDTGSAISGWVGEILDIDTSDVYGNKEKPRGFVQLFPSPKDGSACKRLNLFFRWMVRNTDIDFGLWRGIAPSKLIIPLDAHIGRVSRCLGLTSRKCPCWRTAVEITDSLREFDANDPLKYDFALCHRGIAGLCGRENCEGCELWH